MSGQPDYPPPHHITQDLAPTIDRSEGESVIQLPIVPRVLDGSGGLRIGVAAMAADIVSGETAIREALPGWVATANLSLQVEALPDEGTLCVRPRLLRKGRTTLVQEVGLDHLESSRALGLGTVAFSLLPSRREMQDRVAWAEHPSLQTVFGDGRNQLAAPITERLGFETDPSDPAITRAPMTDYVVNTLGAMQGGVVALLLETAAERFATDRLEGPVRLRSLEIHYLSLARGGPIRATVREVARLREGIWMRVELSDEGREGRLTTVGSVLAESAR